MRRALWIWLGFAVFFALTLVWLLSLTARLHADATLSEVQRLKAELHQTKVALIQTQAQLANCTAQAEVTKLTAERAGLEADYRATLKPPEGAVFDWQTLTFKAPTAPK